MQSWIDGADASDFGLGNLPLGIFHTGDAPRPGVAIANSVVDLSQLIRARLVDDETLLDAPTLNAFIAQERGHWRALRATLRRLLSEDASSGERDDVLRALVPREAVTMLLPIAVGDYVDFYSSIEHATNIGALLRPENPLLPNYRHIPIGYHGRSSSIVIDGTPVRRPRGQTRPIDDRGPGFGPTRMLDLELEIACVTGPGNRLGEPIPIDAALDHIYGVVLLNDWSARDLQAWEYQPLGPFSSKSFATSISPWLVSFDALEPARVANRVLAPPPLPYLCARDDYAYDIELDVLLQSKAMRASRLPAATVARTNFRDMYWNVAQQLAHLTVNGARVRAGDLFGSGTISGSEPGTYGSLMELTSNGTRPLALPSGETRTFLEDGDTVTLRGAAIGSGGRVGLGEVRGTIVS